MKLYAVKIENGYLRRKEQAAPVVVPMSKASVFPELEDAKALRELYGAGQIAELTLTEKILSL